MLEWSKIVEHTPFILLATDKVPKWNWTRLAEAAIIAGVTATIINYTTLRELSKDVQQHTRDIEEIKRNFDSVHPRYIPKVPQE